MNGVLLSTLSNYSFVLLSDTVIPGGPTSGGDIFEYKFEFQAASTLATDTFAFSAAGSSMSLDVVSLDTSLVAAVAVPEPSTWFACLGAASVWMWRRRVARSTS
ncbi:MAG: PEP-CTERM sorting domain-containing protein [Pirellulales bacterium]